MQRARDALEASGTRPEALRAVVLVGGSSRIPLVSELLFRGLGVPVAVDTHPKHDVALGAALTGARPGAQARPTPVPETVPVAAEVVEAAPDTPPVTGPVTTPATPVHEPGRRRRRPVLALVVVLAVLLLAGAVVLGLRGLPSGVGQVAGPAADRTTASAPDSPAGASVPRSAAPLGADVMVWPRLRDKVWGLGTVSLAGTQAPVVGDAALDSSFPVLSPDRRSVIYLRETSEQWSLRVVGADRAGDRLLLGALEGCRRVQAPAWGRDDVLALPCQKSSGAGTTLELVTLDGRVLRILDRGALGDPTFSPRRAPDRVRARRRRSGRRRVALPGPRRGRPPAAAHAGRERRRQRPRGRTVAFRTKRDGVPVIATIPLGPLEAPSRVSTPAILSRGSAVEENPSWSPDGTRLAFVRGVGDRRDVWVMNADGSDRHPVVQDDEADSAPAWTAR